MVWIKTMPRTNIQSIELWRREKNLPQQTKEREKTYDDQRFTQMLQNPDDKKTSKYATMQNEMPTLSDYLLFFSLVEYFDYRMCVWHTDKYAQSLAYTRAEQKSNIVI